MTSPTACGGAGTPTSDIALNGLDGDDTFSITHVSNWQVDDVAVSGGRGEDAARVAIDMGQPLEGFDELMTSTDHVEFYWFPHTDATLLKCNTRVPLEEGLHPLPRWRASARRAEVGNKGGSWRTNRYVRVCQRTSKGEACKHVSSPS